MNELDNQLFSSILSENIDEIGNLLKKGANINAIDKYQDNMIIKYLQLAGYECNIEIIKYLVESNIDTNYEVEGFNCLFNAYLANRDDIAEYLLKIGTSAQCISTDTSETLLDWIEWDVDFEKDEARVSKEWIERSEKIIKLLKDNGATNVDKCITNKVEDYLKMFGGKKSGLFTKRGYININDIPNINEELIAEFNNWHKIDNVFIEKTWNREEINTCELSECNQMGLNIITAIKKLLPDNIRIQYNYIIPEDYIKNKARNIKELIV